MGAFDSGDNTFKTGEGKERVYGFVIGNHVVFYSAQIVEESVLGTGGGVVKTAGYGLHGGGITVFVL